MFEVKAAVGAAARGAESPAGRRTRTLLLFRGSRASDAESDSEIMRVARTTSARKIWREIYQCMRGRNFFGRHRIRLVWAFSHLFLGFYVRSSSSTLVRDSVRS